MPLLIRKLNRAKWPPNNIEDVFQVSADAITNCLKSASNTISVWKIDDRKDLEEAVLAIAAKQDHLESFDVVIIEDTFVNDYSIPIKQIDGKTPVLDLVKLHYDIYNLDYYKIGLLAEHINRRINSNDYKRFTISELKKILRAAVDLKRVDINDLNENIRRKIA